MRTFRLRRMTGRWYVEAPLLAGGYLVFGLARAALDRGDPAATSDAVLVQHLERSLHVAVESSLNHAMLAHPAAVYATGYFYRLALVAVPVTLVWLHVRHRPQYGPLRTLLVLTTALDLPLVWAFPESPPRFAQRGIVDYVATHDILHGSGLRHPQPGVNLLAAMPSMHIAWTTWCAYAAWSVLRQHPSRRACLPWLPWLLPLTTAFVVLATGNHYALDVMGGVVTIALAKRLSRWIGPIKRRKSLTLNGFRAAARG